MEGRKNGTTSEPESKEEKENERGKRRDRLRERAINAFCSLMPKTSSVMRV